MMLMTRDLNLNQFGHPVKEAVKRTMLQHEIVFKNQVRELHRLYWTQKNLMRELYRRELEANEHRETVPPQSFAAGSAKDGNVGSLEEIKGTFVGMSDNRHRGFNLELPADAYVVNSAKNSIGDAVVIGSAEIVRPRCSAKAPVDEKRGAMISMLDKGKNLYCYEVIDLEEPAEVESHVEAQGVSLSAFKVRAENCRVMDSSHSYIVSDMASSSRVHNESGFVPYSSRKEASFVPDLNHRHSDCSERWREHKADHSGAGGIESSVAGLVGVSNDSTHNREPNSSKLMLIDLNIPQDDEASHAVNDPLLTFSSPSSSSSVVQNELLWRDQGNKYLKETSAALNSDAPDSASGGKSMDLLFSGCQDSQRSKVSYFGGKQENEASNKVQESNCTGLTECCRKSVEGFSSGSNGEVRNNANGTALSFGDLNIPIEENEALSSGSSGGLHSITQSDRKQISAILANINSEEDKQANHERSKEDSISSQAVAGDENQQGGLDGKNLSVSKADVPTGSTGCSLLEKIMDENSETTQLDNMVVERSLVKSCNIEQQHDQDHAVVDAAEILAGISLTQPPSPMKQLNCTGLASIATKEDERDQPQYSSDSFEAITLELPEVRSEEHFAPTIQIEVDAGEAARGVNRLRRGRGRVVRDFQKDILPGMVSLSRHEICEDMHSIGYELRKNGSRRVGGGNWFAPVSSRRSRRCPAGRRQ